MNSDSENGSSENRGTSPGILVQDIVEMGEEAETLKDLKRKRATAKAKYTIRKEAILSSLQNSDIPASRVTTSEKEFQDAFEKLSDAHSQYVGARYLDEEDLEPTDATYMDAPIAGLQEVETNWTKWCNARERVLQDANRADREEAQ